MAIRIPDCVCGVTFAIRYRQNHVSRDRQVGDVVGYFDTITLLITGTVYVYPRLTDTPISGACGPHSTVRAWALCAQHPVVIVNVAKRIHVG